MDAFYASVEQLDNPDLRGMPVAVGGSSERGVVAAASYEARKFGVHSAMPSKIAARKCPDLIFVKARFPRYKEISYQIREIFEQYTDLVEPLSLDEAYLDVTVNNKGIPSATLIAKAIRKEILDQTGLTASAGISINKFLAKTASDINKPNGMAVILPEEAEAFVEKLPIQKFHGIGKVTAEKFRHMGIFHGRDLKQLSLQRLVSAFGKSGKYYYDIARAIDHRKVNPNRIRKSLGAERTFSEDIIGENDCFEALDRIYEEVLRRIANASVKAKTLTIKIKYNDFTVITRQKSSIDHLQTKDEFDYLLNDLKNEIDWDEKPIRLLGLSVSNFPEKKVEADEPRQLTIRF